MAKKQNYTLKQKYEFYKDLATNPNAKNSKGEKLTPLGKLACANRANSIRRKMRKNKNRYDFYTRSN